jgi:hypothetical protein
MVSEGASPEGRSPDVPSAEGPSAAPRDPEPRAQRAERPRPKERSTEEIRVELTTEREQLTGALAELRAEVQSARRIPMIIGGALLAGIAGFVAFKAVRGRHDD